MRTLLYSLGCAVLLSGCMEPGEYEYGFELTTMTIEITDLTMGVHPSRSVLQDANNPFRAGLGPETKWLIESHDDSIPEYAGSIPRFYAWATMTAYEPTGENQYYTGLALGDMWTFEEAKGADLVFVRDMAIDAYQSVLDNFPDSVSYLADGVSFFPLAPLAYYGIKDLGGEPQGGWVEVTNEDGETTVIRRGY